MSNKNTNRVIKQENSSKKSIKHKKNKAICLAWIFYWVISDEHWNCRFECIVPARQYTCLNEIASPAPRALQSSNSSLSIMV